MKRKTVWIAGMVITAVIAVLFAGYPVWWHATPAPVNTFLETYDLAHKLIIPFCTSGGAILTRQCPRSSIPATVWRYMEKGGSGERARLRGAFGTGADRPGRTRSARTGGGRGASGSAGGNSGSGHRNFGA